MWFVTNNIDSHSIEWELMFINIPETAQYGLEIIFKLISWTFRLHDSIPSSIIYH